MAQSSRALSLRYVKYNNNLSPLSNERQYEEHPDMHSNDKRILEQYLAEHELAQVQRAVDDDQRELEDQHYEEGNWDFVLF